MNLKERTDVRGCRALIAAILDQAFSDAISRQNIPDKRSAIKFIDKDNEMFITYCEMLDLDPEYVAQRMQAQIRKLAFKPIKQFRE